MSYSMNSLKTFPTHPEKALKRTTVIQKKNTFCTRFLLAHPLPTSKSPQSINLSQLKTNSLIAENEAPPHPSTYPMIPWVNPARPSEFHKPNSGGSSVAAFSLNSNLQSLQKAMETSATCIACTLEDMQNLTEVVSTFLLTKLCMIYGLQIPAKVVTNGTTRNPDVSFLWGCPWVAS